MLSVASTTSQGSSYDELSQAASSSARGRDLFTSGLIVSKVAFVLIEYLSAEKICSLSRVNKASYSFCNAHKIKLIRLYYKDLLFNHLLPGIKEEQLPCTLTSYDSKTRELIMEETYKVISKMVYGPLFFERIGVRVAPANAIPQSLLEKKYLPTYIIEIPAGSPLGLSRDGRLTNGPQDAENPHDPDHYAPAGHRHYRPRPAEDVEGFRTLEFPNTQYNRDFLEADPSLKVASYPMLSPLEQGSPLINYQTELEIDVPDGSALRSINGVLTEDGSNEPVVNKTRTVKFLNTPRNWLTLSAPILTDPSRAAGPDNPIIAKYLNENAKPVGISYIWESIKPILDALPSSEWKAPTTSLVALGGTYSESVVEAEAIGSHPLTFQQDSIHRILTQIRGNLDLYSGLFSRTSTEAIASWGSSYKVGTYVYQAAVAPAAPARVHLDNARYDFGNVGLAAAWGPAGSL